MLRYTQQYKYLHTPVKPALTISASHGVAHQQNCLLERNMFRLLKALPLTLALVSLCIFAASCGSSNQSQVRAVQAISDEQTNLDIAVNTTKVATNVGFEGVQPTPPAYTKVPSGTVTLQAYDTGTTTSIVGANGVSTSLSGSTQYTILLTGFENGTGPTAPTFWTIPDNNAAPTSGNAEIRIINGSANTPTGGFDVYIVTDPNQLGTAGIQGLTLGQGSSYQSVVAGNWVVIVTPHGNQTAYINQNYTLTSGQIQSLVIVDSGNQVSQIPLPLNDVP
jgi:Domain of unknown function (DUF4397)